ncbi:unnamed protein product [Ectocarpus sp. 12 AP-2014]
MSFTTPNIFFHNIGSSDERLAKQQSHSNTTSRHALCTMTPLCSTQSTKTHSSISCTNARRMRSVHKLHVWLAEFSSVETTYAGGCCSTSSSSLVDAKPHAGTTTGSCLCCRGN